jgi:phenylacetate-CoA oxygenase PaaH subunit
VIWEVFRQERKGQPFQHAGSLDAPDLHFAEIYARDFYGRRNESVALWVVPRHEIEEIEEFSDELGRNYHRVDGYSLKAKLKEARERVSANSSPQLPRGPGDPSLRSGGAET